MDAEEALMATAEGGDFPALTYNDFDRPTLHLLSQWYPDILGERGRAVTVTDTITLFQTLSDLSTGLLRSSELELDIGAIPEEPEDSPEQQESRRETKSG